MSAPRRRGKRLEPFDRPNSSTAIVAVAALLHRPTRRRRPAPPPYSPSQTCSTALLHRCRRRRPTPPLSSSQTYSTDRDWLERGFDRGAWPEPTADCFSSTAIVTVPSSRSFDQTLGFLLAAVRVCSTSSPPPWGFSPPRLVEDRR
ncbi:hypothetical protein E3N88_07245 [Mikania micrantha]|uniref:Uncharacterized protein n=1 Tax=Mikania micrantha TaxID=192012 RepID=A0A5N6PTV7_9ASTR|nr:hypothetical protein E3N88_07245 [Mikania micrantha]